MRYLSLFIRLAIIIIWIYMIIKNPEHDEATLLSGIQFVLIWIFISMLSVFWGKSIRCPFIKCEWENCKK